MKIRTELQQGAQGGLMRGHANATLRHPYYSRISTGGLLQRIAIRLMQFFSSKRNENPGFDTSFGEHVNLPKELLENLDQQRSASRVK